MMDSFTPNGTIGRLQIMPGTCELEKPEKILTKPPGICDEWLKRATEEYESKSWWGKQHAKGFEADRTKPKEIVLAEDFKKNCEMLPDEIPEKYIDDLRQQLNDYVNGKARWMDPEYALGLRGALPLLEHIYNTGTYVTASPPPYTEAEKEWIAKQQNDVDILIMGVWAAPGVIARMAGASEQHVKEVNEQISAPILDMLTAHTGAFERNIFNAKEMSTRDIPLEPPSQFRTDGVRVTGGRKVDTTNYFKFELEAANYYEMIRLLDGSDVINIAKNIGWPEYRVQRVKNHLFINDTHVLRGGQVSRFAPDIEIADAWSRLQNGTYTKEDIKLLEHEYFESRFEKIFNSDYDTAHGKTIESGRDWDPYRE